jgi:hypothetical protein
MFCADLLSCIPSTEHALFFSLFSYNSLMANMDIHSIFCVDIHAEHPRLDEQINKLARTQPNKPLAPLCCIPR